MVNKNEITTVQAGEIETKKALEYVTRRNVESAIKFGNDTRKMVLELHAMFEALQNNVMNIKNEVNELRRQLSLLQGEFYKKGTVSYSGDDDSKSQ